ncbi:MAG: TonB-dependent receptor [Flavobacteriia bacterium]|nr:TonB-dependent receptor [Flavobacteriia bacterium]
MRKLLTSSLLVVSVLTHAQSDENLIQQVDVFGEKAPSSLFEGQHIEILTAEQIEASAVKSINELLEYASAVDVRQRGPYDVQADVSVRGGTFDQTLILLNGVPMNDPQTGHHNMNLPISIDEIERIEVLHGGASHRYGPYAFSGAINIITKSPNTNEAYVEAEGGEYAYFGGSFGASHKFSETLSARVGANYAESDGYLNNTDFSRRNVNAELRYSKEDLVLNLQGGWNTKGFGAQNFYSSAFPYQYEATSTLFGSLNGTYTTGQFLFNFNAYIRNHTDRFELYRETGDEWYEYNQSAGVYIRGNDTAASWYAGPNFHKTNVRGGEFNTVHQSILGKTLVGFDLRDEDILSNNLGVDMETPIEVPGTRFNYTKSDNRTNSGIFLHHRVDIENWTLSGSLRYNMNTAFGNTFLPGFEVAFSIPNSGKVYASYNRSFRLPTFTDLYYSLGGAQGSIGLQPEYSHNYELGYKGQAKYVTAQASLFLRDGTNMIDWVVLPSDSSSTLRAQNITELTIYGVDGDINFKVGEFTKNYVKNIRLSAAFLNSPTDQFDFQSLYVLDFLAAKVSIGVTHDFGHGFGLSWQVTGQDRMGSYVDFSTGRATPYAPVALIDARLSWTNDQWMVFVDGNNLLDRVYQDRGNVLQPGRWVRGGVRYSFKY